MSGSADTADAAIHVANEYAAWDQHAAALAAYTRALDMGAARGHVLALRALCHVRAGSVDDALVDARGAVSADGSSAMAQYALGVACHRSGAWAEGVTAFEAALAAQPEPPQPRWRKLLAECQRHVPGAAAAKYRNEWYQNDQFVIVTLFIKKTTPEATTITYTDTGVSVSVQLGGGAEYCAEWELYDGIVPAECSFRNTPSKIEIRLRKSRVIKWDTLEGHGKAARVHAYHGAGAAGGGADEEAKVKHMYPSSKGARDWDSLAAALDDELGEDGADKYGGNVNKVFQDIYAGGTDEQRRAMMKSYAESGGTVLSTNWSEVGKGEVKPVPPKA